MLRQTRQTLLDAAPEKFRLMYTNRRDHSYWVHHDPGHYMGESREAQYLQLLGAKTPDEFDAIVGDPSWTHIWCDECEEYKGSGVLLGQTRDCMAMVCDDCLKKSFMLAFQPQERKLCDHGFGVGFCVDQQCQNHVDSTKVP